MIRDGHGNSLFEVDPTSRLRYDESSAEADTSRAGDESWDWKRSRLSLFPLRYC